MTDHCNLDAGTTLAATPTTARSVNILGEVASVTEADGDDAAGNRTSATDPNTGKTTFTHTALGQTRTVCDALGQPATMWERTRGSAARSASTLKSNYVRTSVRDERDEYLG